MFNNEELLKLYRFNLQMFADDLEGVEDDDGTEDLEDSKENDIDDENENVDLEQLLKGLAEDDDAEDEDESENNQTPDDEEDADGKSQEHEADPEEKFQQRLVEELNRIIPGRLARDRKTQQVSHLEQVTGMSIEDITKTVIKNMVEDKAGELGISVEEAQKIIDKDIENAGYKAEKESTAQQQQEISTAQQQVKYLEDRMSFTKKPKLARFLTKEVLEEIDNFTQKGTLLSFEDGMDYILGKRFRTGDIAKKLQDGAEQKANRNIAKKSKAVPQTKAGAKSESIALTKDEKEIAAFLGLSEKEYAEEKMAMAKEKRKAR